MIAKHIPRAAHDGFEIIKDSPWPLERPIIKVSLPHQRKRLTKSEKTVTLGITMISDSPQISWGFFLWLFEGSNLVHAHLNDILCIKLPLHHPMLTQCNKVPNQILRQWLPKTLWTGVRHNPLHSSDIDSISVIKDGAHSAGQTFLSLKLSPTHVIEDVAGRCEVHRKQCMPPQDHMTFGR